MAASARPHHGRGAGSIATGRGFGRRPNGTAARRHSMPAVKKPVEFVVQVRCLQCRHMSFLRELDLTEFDIAANAPIAAFVKRLRCTKCRSGSVMANRVAST